GRRHSTISPRSLRVRARSVPSAMSTEDSVGPERAQAADDGSPEPRKGRFTRPANAEDPGRAVVSPASAALHQPAHRQRVTRHAKTGDHSSRDVGEVARVPELLPAMHVGY